jgi:hypothetical protein
VSSTTDLGLYRARAAALAPRDVAGWLDLAAWARSHAMATQAREAYDVVLATDPENASAHVGLGDVRVAGRWLSADDANRARGLVEFEGTWMTPDERQARLADRAAMADERRALREADARVREAEARVREAEARARTAEAEARQAQQPPSGGVPYPWVFGPGYGAGYGAGYGGIVTGPFTPFPPHRPGMGGHGDVPPPGPPTTPDMTPDHWRHLKH